MPREIPDVPHGWKPPQPVPGRSYDIELVTPMFGGGVVTRENDRSYPIRATAIRGQLQFWWRATVGAQYSTRQELRAAQSAIWGDTSQASRVQVRVDLLEKLSEPKPCAVIKPNHKGRDQVFWEAPFFNTALPYALFPFQGKPENHEGPKVDPASCIHKVRFRLTLHCDERLDFAKQVEPALWAWVNFGGLGSRTRRGCGAVLCKALAPKDVNDLKAMWVRHMPEPFPPREWPTLAKAMLTDRDHPTALKAWERVIDRFRHFRQGEGSGRNQGQQHNRPGRSRFPEPEAIRRVTGQRNGRHARLSQIPDDAFPRAELGLPIVFHFQNERNDKPRDPDDTVLYPDHDSEGKPRERMASPLILKPLALQNGRAVPLILRLQHPGLTGVELRRGNTSLGLPPTTVVRDPRLASYPNSPLAGSPNGSAIEAFIDFSGFTEVTR